MGRETCQSRGTKSKGGAPKAPKPHTDAPNPPPSAPTTSLLGHPCQPPERPERDAPFPLWVSGPGYSCCPTVRSAAPAWGREGPQTEPRGSEEQKESPSSRLPRSSCAEAEAFLFLLTVCLGSIWLESLTGAFPFLLLSLLLICPVSFSCLPCTFFLPWQPAPFHQAAVSCVSAVACCLEALAPLSQAPLHSSGHALWLIGTPRTPS